MFVTLAGEEYFLGCNAGSSARVPSQSTPVAGARHLWCF